MSTHAAIPASYYVSRSKTGSLSSRVPDEGPFPDKQSAIEWARRNSAGFRSVTILRDSCGADHPDNAGKRFLDHILK